MDDKEIREKAAEVLLAGTENVSGFTQEPLWRPREAVTALSLANLLMTADALEAMEACVAYKQWSGSARPTTQPFQRMYDAGHRILAKREQEKGPRYVVEVPSAATPHHWVRDTRAARRDPPSRFWGTESECIGVAAFLNKHAGEK